MSNSWYCWRDPRGQLHARVVVMSGLGPGSSKTQSLPLLAASQALKFEPGTHVVSSGALATTSGKKTGEHPGLC
jgi:hypothetical protein